MKREIDPENASQVSEIITLWENEKLLTESKDFPLNFLRENYIETIEDRFIGNVQRMKVRNSEFPSLRFTS
jgi:hypothetical protein